MIHPTQELWFSDFSAWHSWAFTVLRLAFPASTPIPVLFPPHMSCNHGWRLYLLPSTRSIRHFLALTPGMCPSHQHVLLLKTYTSFRSLQREEPAQHTPKYIQHVSICILTNFPRGTQTTWKIKINTKQNKWKKKIVTEEKTCVQVFGLTSSQWVL